MGMVDDLKKFIYEEEVGGGKAVSESTWIKIAGMLNFIGHRNHQEKQFFINGPYSIIATPQTFVDGLVFFEYDAEIINVWVYNITPGVSGTTELDLKIKPKTGGSWASIFTTTPKITSAAATNTFFCIGDSGTGITAPELTSNPLSVNAGDALRIDVLQAMSQAQNCGIVVHYRPR